MATKTFVREELKFFSENPYHLLGLSCTVSNDAVLSAYMRLQKLINFNAVENYSRVISIDRLSLPKYSLEMLSKVYSATSTMESKVFAFSSIKYTAPLTMIRVSTLLETTTTYDAFLGCYLWLLENDIGFIHMDMWELLCKRIDEMIDTSAVKWKEVFDNRLSQNDIADKKDCYEEFHEAFCNIILSPLKNVVEGSHNIISAKEMLEAVKKQKGTKADTKAEKKAPTPVATVAPEKAQKENLSKDIIPEKPQKTTPADIKSIKAEDTILPKQNVINNNSGIDEIKTADTSKLKSFELKNEVVIDAIKPVNTSELKSFELKNEAAIDAIKPVAVDELKEFVVKNEVILDSIDEISTDRLEAPKSFNELQFDAVSVANTVKTNENNFIYGNESKPEKESLSFNTKPKSAISDTDNEIMKLLGHIKSGKIDTPVVPAVKNSEPTPVVEAVKPEMIESPVQKAQKMNPDDEIQNLLRQIQGTKPEGKSNGTTVILADIMDDEPVAENKPAQKVVEPVIAPPQPVAKKIVEPVIAPPQPVAKKIVEPVIIPKNIIRPEPIAQAPKTQQAPVTKPQPDDDMQRLLRQIETGKDEKVFVPTQHTVVLGPEIQDDVAAKEEPVIQQPVSEPEVDDPIKRLLKQIEEDGERYFSANGQNSYNDRPEQDNYSNSILLKNNSIKEEENSGKISLLDGVNVSDNIYAKITQEGRNNKCIMDGLAIVDNNVEVMAAEKVNSQYKMGKVNMVATEQLVAPVQHKAKQMGGIISDSQGVHEVRGEDNGYRMNTGGQSYLNNDINTRTFENMSYEKRSQRKASGLIGMLFWLVILLGGGGAALYYFVLK